MDGIDDIVQQAIAYTDDLLSRSPGHYQIARDGLQRMRENLAQGAADHPALGRLDAYIADLESRFTH